MIKETGIQQATGEMARYSLTDWRKDLGLLGNFPDKAVINRLTQFAEDYASPDPGYYNRVGDVVKILEDEILNPSMPSDRKLPLCYLMDSILKNVGEPYTSVFERNIVRTFCETYERVRLSACLFTYFVQSKACCVFYYIAM